jgi:hypothetical protein
MILTTDLRGGGKWGNVNEKTRETKRGKNAWQHW